MSNETEIIQAIQSLSPTVSSFSVDKGKITAWDNAEEPTGVKQPTDAEINAEVIRLKAVWNAQEYARKREAEYPSIKELIVALYDTEDRAAIDAKRAAVKAKYPKGAS